MLVAQGAMAVEVAQEDRADLWDESRHLAYSRSETRVDTGLSPGDESGHRAEVKEMTGLLAEFREVSRLLAVLREMSRF